MWAQECEAKRRRQWRQDSWDFTVMSCRATCATRQAVRQARTALAGARARQCTLCGKERVFWKQLRCASCACRQGGVCSSHKTLQPAGRNTWSSSLGSAAGMASLTEWMLLSVKHIQEAQWALVVRGHTATSLRGLATPQAEPGRHWRCECITVLALVLAAGANHCNCTKILKVFCILHVH